MYCRYIAQAFLLGVTVCRRVMQLDTLSTLDMLLYLTTRIAIPVVFI